MEVARKPVEGRGTDGSRETGALDVVVVAYRSAALLDECLEAIVGDVQCGTVVPARTLVIVVDNASPDDSARVASAHEGVQVVISSSNRGFGGGCNLGAAAGDAEYLFFVNPDARPESGCTSRLLQELAGEPLLGAVGAAVLDPTGANGAVQAGFEPSLRSIIGHYLFVGRLPIVGRWFPPLQLPRGTTERRPDWISGAALLVRRAAFESVAGFDDSIFMYMEDVDLCRRMREDGWGIGYVPEAVVHHELGGSQGMDQAARWIRSFYAYLRRRHGALYTAACSQLAGLGLGLRAAAYAPSRPRLSRRLARAAGEAIRLPIAALRRTGADA
jgi:N-acetylglucosaminyl-diphospho-decaprenol L-rhamnosyltransferase